MASDAVEKARQNFDRCMSMMPGTPRARQLLYQAHHRVIAAVRTESPQGGHVANCYCHTEWGQDIVACLAAQDASGEHDHPYIDPRCVGGLLVVARAELKALTTWRPRELERELRAEVERLEKEAREHNERG